MSNYQTELAKVLKCALELQEDKEVETWVAVSYGQRMANFIADYQALIVGAEDLLEALEALADEHMSLIRSEWDMRAKDTDTVVKARAAIAKARAKGLAQHVLQCPL